MNADQIGPGFVFDAFSGAWVPLGIFLCALILGKFALSLFKSYINKGYADRRGQYGENKVRKVLRGLGNEYTVFNDIRLPAPRGKSTQIDHLVVSPYGVTVIETKNWSKAWLFCGPADRHWTLLRTYGRKKTQAPNPFKQNEWHLKAVLRATDLKREHLKNMVVLASNNCKLKTAQPEGLFYADELNGYFRRQREEVLSDEEIEQVIRQINDAEVSSSEMV